MRNLPPAIPNQEPLFDCRFFEISERITVFDDAEHERMKKRCNHIIKGDLDGQLSMDGGLWIG